MVDRLVAGGHIRSAEVEAAFRKVPRHLFLPGVALAKVHGGAAIPTKLDEGGLPLSSSSEPAVTARMLEEMDLKAGLKRSLKSGPGRATMRPFWPSLWALRGW